MGGGEPRAGEGPTPRRFRPPPHSYGFAHGSAIGPFRRIAARRGGALPPIFLGHLLALPRRNPYDIHPSGIHVGRPPHLTTS